MCLYLSDNWSPGTKTFIDDPLPCRSTIGHCFDGNRWHTHCCSFVLCGPSLLWYKREHSCIHLFNFANFLLVCCQEGFHRATWRRDSSKQRKRCRMWVSNTTELKMKKFNVVLSQGTVHFKMKKLSTTSS